MKKKYVLMLSVPVVIIVIGVLAYFGGLGGNTITGSIPITGQATVTGEYDDFAKCLANNGAVLYGTYWCPHCQNQKEMFGSSLQYITYVECAADGENANPAACQEAGVTGYPTWVINGERYPGEKTMERLAEISGCSL